MQRTNFRCKKSPRNYITKRTPWKGSNKKEGEIAMDAYQMRDWVKSAYPGPNWKTKVDKMSDEQIIALYFSLVKQGKIKN
jgi:hypothetical protein